MQATNEILLSVSTMGTVVQGRGRVGSTSVPNERKSCNIQPPDAVSTRIVRASAFSR